MPEHILKAHTLTVDLPSGVSTQPTDDFLVTPNDALEPPVPLEVLRALTETSDVRHSCIDAIATNTVGLGFSLEVDARATCAVVLTAYGYPDAPRKGDAIGALPKASEDCRIFHAGTRLDGKSLVTSGGRVLCVTALGDKVKSWDPSRLVNHASGWTDQGGGDVHDIHNYPGPAAPPAGSNRRWTTRSIASSRVAANR